MRSSGSGGGCGCLNLLASLHEALAQLGDDAANRKDERAKQIEDGGEKELEHKGGMNWMLWLRVSSVPFTALVLEFAA